MFFSKRQIQFFGAKQVTEREWHRQNRLREPFIRQYEARLKQYYNKMAVEVFEAYNTGSTTILNLKINDFRKDLQNIFRIQYTIIANAFKNYALDRMQNVKDLILILIES